MFFCYIIRQKSLIILQIWNIYVIIQKIKLTFWVSPILHTACVTEESAVWKNLIWTNGVILNDSHSFKYHNYNMLRRKCQELWTKIIISDWIWERILSAGLLPIPIIIYWNPEAGIWYYYEANPASVLLDNINAARQTWNYG